MTADDLVAETLRLDAEATSGPWKKPKQKASSELLKQIAAEHRRNSRWWGRELHDAAWAAAYEEAARRVEGAPKIGMTRVWREFDKWWKHVYATRRGVFDEQRLKRRKIAALVRAELRRKEER